MSFLALYLLSAALVAAHSFPAGSGRFSLFRNMWLFPDFQKEGKVIFLLIVTEMQTSYLVLLFF